MTLIFLNNGGGGGVIGPGSSRSCLWQTARFIKHLLSVRLKTLLLLTLALLGAALVLHDYHSSRPQHDVIDHVIKHQRVHRDVNDKNNADDGADVSDTSNDDDDDDDDVDDASEAADNNDVDLALDDAAIHELNDVAEQQQQQEPQQNIQQGNQLNTHTMYNVSRR